MRSSTHRHLALLSLLWLALPSDRAAAAQPEPPATKAVSRALRLAGHYATRVIGDGRSGAFNLELTQEADGAFTVHFRQPHDRRDRPIHFTAAGAFIDGPFSSGNRRCRPSDAYGSYPAVSTAYQLVKAIKALGLREAQLDAMEQHGRYLISIQYAGQTLLETFDALAGRLDGRHATARGTTSFEEPWHAPARGTVQVVARRSRLPKDFMKRTERRERVLRVKIGSRTAYVAFDPSKIDYGVELRPARSSHTRWVAGTFERLGPTGRYLIVSKELSSSDDWDLYDLDYRESPAPRRLYRVDLVTGAVAPEASFDPTVALAEKRALEAHRKSHPVNRHQWDRDTEALERDLAARRSRAAARQLQGEKQRNRRADRGDPYVP